RGGGHSDLARTWRVLLLLAAGATLMMLKPSGVLWEGLPKLRFVQFPWRWMSIVALGFVWLPAAGIRQPPRRAGWLVATFLVLAANGVVFVRSTWWDADDVPTLQYQMDHGLGFEGTDEYDPIGDDHYNLPAKGAQPPATILSASPGTPEPAARVFVQRWTAEQRW